MYRAIFLLLLALEPASKLSNNQTRQHRNQLSRFYLSESKFWKAPCLASTALIVQGDTWCFHKVNANQSTKYVIQGLGGVIAMEATHRQDVILYFSVVVLITNTRRGNSRHDVHPWTLPWPETFHLWTITTSPLAIFMHAQMTPSDVLGCCKLR